MSDSTGIYQHAIFDLPDFHHGYCIDDNARALIATIRLEELLGKDPEVHRLSKCYASFVQHAFNPDGKRFRNFMGFNRSWLEAEGSEDSQGRALWALGICAHHSQYRHLTAWATHLFEQAFPVVFELRSPRTAAYALLGIKDYQQGKGTRLPLADQARQMLTQQLLDHFQDTATEDWPWFESSLSYANAVLPHALISVGGDHPQALDLGLRSLRWLVALQKAPQGHFRPIGSQGFFIRDGERANFDQQPIEAHSTILACLEAYRSTSDKTWYDEACIAFEWFLGRNDLNEVLCDPDTGACYDGLHRERANRNQGAESTLAYMMSWIEIQLNSKSPNL